MCFVEPVIELIDDIKIIIDEVLDVTKDLDTHDFIDIANIVGGPWHQAYRKDDCKHEQIISKEEMYRYYLNKNLLKSANDEIDINANLYLKVKKH